MWNYSLLSFCRWLGAKTVREAFINTPVPALLSEVLVREAVVFEAFANSPADAVLDVTVVKEVILNALVRAS